MDWNFQRRFELRDAMQTVANDFNFGVELRLVDLVAENRSRRKVRNKGTAVQREPETADDFHYRSEADLARNPIDRDARNIARRSERYEQRQALRVRQTNAAG